MKLRFLIDDDEDESSLKHKFISRPKKLSGHYGCMITFEKGEVKNEIRYKLNIDFSKTQNGNNLFKIDRAKELFINDLPPDSFIDELAFETSKVLYPLELEVLNDGSIKSIQNFDEIKERWIKAEKKIKTYYKGEFADKYLKLTAKALKIEERLINKLTKDWFFYMYFKLFTKYDYKEELMQFPTAGKALPVSYKVTHKVEERSDAEDVLIRINGKIKDERCALDLEQELDYPYFKSMDENEKDLKGTCDITYSLSNKTRIIEGIDATFNTEYLDPKKVIVKMFLLNNTTSTTPKKSYFLD